jgi:hypothetical protein
MSATLEYVLAVVLQISLSKPRLPVEEKQLFIYYVKIINDRYNQW